MLAFDFSTDITPSTINQAAFDESLRAIAEDGRDVGFYECDVSAGTNGKGVVVNMRSEYSIADTKYSAILTSELDSQLNLLNETYERTHKTKDQVIKRIIRTYRELNDFVVEIEEQLNAETTKSTRRQSVEDVDCHLASGAVLIVERIYALTSAESKLTVNALDADGSVCSLVCEYLGENNVAYDGKNVSEVGMKQTLYTTAGNVTTTYKYFTIHGQLLSVVQVGLPVVFKAIDPPPPITKSQYLHKPTIKSDDFYWKDNYMLFSKFIERKEELKSQYHLYLYNHPEFVDLVKDFLQRILMEKPKDTLNFAADFFTTFSKRQLLPPRLKRM